MLLKKEKFWHERLFFLPIPLPKKGETGNVIDLWSWTHFTGLSWKLLKYSCFNTDSNRDHIKPFASCANL